MSVCEFVELLGITRTTYYAMMHGEGKRKPKTVEKIAKNLGLNQKDIEEKVICPATA
jgi:hypothetical protein